MAVEYRGLRYRQNVLAFILFPDQMEEEEDRERREEGETSLVQRLDPACFIFCW